ADPGTAQPFTLEHPFKDIRIGMRHVAKRIRADEGVDVDHGFCSRPRGFAAGRFSARRFAAVGKLRRGGGESCAALGDCKPKTRAALRQRMSRMSSADESPVFSSARNLAS